MQISKTFIAASAFFVLPGLALAAAEPTAKLTNVSGPVMIDTGDGFKAVSGPVVPLKVGDRVMLTKDGQAVLSYAPNCTIPLESPSVTVVEEAGCVVSTQGDTGAGGGGLGGAGMGMGMIGLTVGSFIPAFTSAANEVANDEDNPVSP
jgi:hypothetical protein